MQATTHKPSVDEQISDLITKRYELHSELTRAMNRSGTEWWSDRARELDYVNRQISRLQALQTN